MTNRGETKPRRSRHNHGAPDDDRHNAHSRRGPHLHTRGRRHERSCVSLHGQPPRKCHSGGPGSPSQRGSATYAQPTLLDGSFHRGLLKPRTRGGCRASTPGAGDAGAASCFPTTGSSTTDDMRGTRCHSSWFANHGTLDLLATYRHARLAPEPGPLPYHWNMAGENLRRGTGLRAHPRRHHHGKH